MRLGRGLGVLARVDHGVGIFRAAEAGGRRRRHGGGAPLGVVLVGRRDVVLVGVRDETAVAALALLGVGPGVGEGETVGVDDLGDARPAPREVPLDGQRVRDRRAALRREGPGARRAEVRGEARRRPALADEPLCHEPPVGGAVLVLRVGRVDVFPRVRRAAGAPARYDEAVVRHGRFAEVDDLRFAGKHVVVEEDGLVRRGDVAPAVRPEGGPVHEGVPGYGIAARRAVRDVGEAVGVLELHESAPVADGAPRGGGRNGCASKIDNQEAGLGRVFPGDGAKRLPGEQLWRPLPGLDFQREQRRGMLARHAGEREGDVDPVEFRDELSGAVGEGVPRLKVG